MNEFKIKNGLVVSGSADVEQNLTVNGILTAKQYNVSLISSSILFESGSTQLGNSLDDTHLFTGSIKVTGSITLNGQPIGTGKLDETTFENYTSSTDSRLGLLENSTGSIRNDFNSFTSSYTNVSGSLDSRLDTLETLSGSFTGSFSGSFVGDGTNLFNIPASGVTGLNLTQIADGSVTASVSNTNGLRVNSKSEITGSLIVTNGITGSIDYSNITNKPTLVSGSVQIEITGTTGYSTFSSSISSSIGSLSSSLDLLSSSIATTDSNQNTRLGLIETSTGSLNTFTSSALTRLGLIETSTGSLNSFTSSALTRVSAIETSTGSLNLFTSSIDTTIKTKLNSENVISGSIQVNITGTTGYSTFSSSISSSIGDLSSSVATTTNNLSSSIATTDLNQSNRIGNLEVSTGSLNSFTSSIDTTIKNKLNSDGVISGSSQVTLSATTGYSDFSSSIATTDLNQSNRLNSIETSTGSLNSFTSSIDTTIKTKLNAENVVSGSSQILNGTTIHSGTFFNGITVVSGSSQISYTGITDIPSGLVSGSSQVLSGTGIWSGSAQLPNGVVSGSSQVDITGTTNYTSFSSSIATTDLNQNNRLDSIETKTGSYATTGSNVFKDNQTISGSLIITQNLTVFGSSSITYVTSSQLRVDDNIITVNTASPGSRFGGLEVHDSGSVGIATGSILWDSVNNRWIYQQSSEATYGGGVLLSGPRSSGSLGSELTLTSGKIARSAGGDHLNDSIITEYGGTTIGISGNLEISGSLVIPSTPLVSGSSQISYTGITNVPSGIVSGSLQVLNGSGVWSGSAQLPAGTVSGSSQVLLSSGVWSGSAQLPAGVVSGSSQITYSGISGIPSGIISGSSQVSFGSISGIPSGLVSGSSQVLLSSGVWSGSAQLPSGVVSGSSQVLSGTGIWSGSAQLPSGVVSGSAQTIANLPSGTVSGSSQITLTSGQVTTGLGYTPYNATNPSGYITSYSETDTLATVTARGATTGVDTIYTGGLKTRKSQTAGDYTTAALWVESHSNTATGIAFHISGVKGTYLEMRTNQVLYWDGNTVYHSGNLTNNNQLTNGAGYITGINSSAVTTALGYTPYNATNPSGYISSITSGNVTTALGYTPYNATNPNGYITSSATTLSLTGNLTVSSGNSTGGGIILADDGDIVDLNDAYLSLRFSSGVRIYSANRGGSAVITLGNTGVVTATTFSGALSGNATTATTAGALTSMNISQFTNNSGYLTSISSGNVTTALGYTPYNATNPNGYITGISFANVSSKPTTISGYGITDAITTGNIGSQSVNYANTAGNITAYTINQSVGTSNSPTFAEVYANNWFRNNESNEGLYNTANGNHFYSTSSSDWVVTGAGGGVALQFRSNHQSTLRGYVHGDTSSNFGLLDNTGNWQVRCNPSNSGGQLYNSWILSGNFTPTANNTYNLGSVSLGWANVYTNDLHLSNMNKPEGNDVDGTKGTWTIQEGAENLYIINNNNGKKFKINLEEII